MNECNIINTIYVTIVVMHTFANVNLYQVIFSEAWLNRQISTQTCWRCCQHRWWPEVVKFMVIFFSRIIKLQPRVIILHH